MSSGVVRAASVILAALWLGGCGYHTASASFSDVGPVAVRAGELTSPDVEALSEAVAGARSALAREDALGDASARAAVVIDVVAVSETGRGVSVSEHGDTPFARGVRLRVTGRARLVRAGRVSRDTGDQSEEETVAAGRDPATFEPARDDAVRRAARRLGERLIRRLFVTPP